MSREADRTFDQEIYYGTTRLAVGKRLSAVGRQGEGAMSTAEQYRAFARECIKWADSAAKTIEHREILLEMATHWAEAAARLEHQHALIDDFDELVNNARANLHAAHKVSATDGRGRSQQTNGSGQPRPSEVVSYAKHHHQPPERGETSIE